jgi:acetyl esterase/lipase
LRIRARRATVVAGAAAAGAMVCLLPTPLTAPASAHYRPCVQVEPAKTAKTRGHLMMIHGGAWLDDSDIDGELDREGGQRGCELSDLRRKFPEFERRIRAAARIGYRVHVPDYFGVGRPNGARGADSLRQLAHFYDHHVRGRRGPACASGGSAGGHLALMLGARRRLDCILTRSVPVDISKRLLGGSYGHPGGGAEALYRLACDAFCPGERRNSPLFRASSVRRHGTPEVTVAHGRNDYYIPDGSVRAFVRRYGPARLRMLSYDPKGACFFGHPTPGARNHPGTSTRVSCNAAAAVFALEHRILGRLAR